MCIRRDPDRRYRFQRYRFRRQLRPASFDSQCRCSGWKSDFGSCYLRYVIETPHAVELEKAFQKHHVAIKRRFTEFFGGRNQTELFRIDEQFSEENAVEIARNLLKRLLSREELEWRHEERIRQMSTREVEARERSEQGLHILNARKEKTKARREKTKHAQLIVRAQEEKTKQLRLRLKLERSRRGGDVDEVPGTEGRKCPKEIESNGVGGDESDSDSVESLSEDDSTDDESIFSEEDDQPETIAVSKFKTLHIVEERGRVLDWAKTWPVFQAWLKVEFPGITMVKGAAKRVFDENLNGLYATHRDKVTGKTPLGWKGYRLIENVTPAE
jgi:hypothetical protein